MAPRETENNAYAKFWGDNKEHYGMSWYFWSGQLQFMHTLTNPTIPHIVLFRV